MTANSKCTIEQRSQTFYETHTAVHVVLGSHMRPCKPSGLDLTIANTWVRLQQSSQGGSL